MISSTSHSSPIVLLCNTSFTQKDILLLLSSLTDCSPIEPNVWNDIIYNIPNNHYIFTYTFDNKLIGMITIIIEQKIIHGGRKVAHIEDLVILPEYRGAGIGKQLLDFAKNFAKDNNCYKVILDCNENLIPFYKANQFTQKAVQMALYF
jgi:glucosamine-phosphate N-acetyltransferase